ncbi:MAG: hypothetical protein FJ090_18175 [Deltaproteobacteria bacterium]|nr:hypothetical protein [Deltaproteobacteria bacterium]
MRFFLLIGLLGTSGCVVDSTVKHYTEPPQVTIETPVDGAALDEAVPVLMRGRVTDEAFEDSLSAITATWAVNGGRACEGAVVDVNGITECESTFDRGTATVSLTAVNPDGKSASAVVELEVVKNDAPLAEIVSPTDGNDYFANQLTLFEGLVSDGEDRAEEMSVTWESSVDGVLGFSSTPTSDGKTNGSTMLTVGEHQITLTVTDSTGRTGSDTTTIDVAVGEKPEIELVSPVMGDVVNLDEIVFFEAKVSDYEDDPETMSLSWESDLDGVFSTQSASSDGNAAFSFDSLSRGVHTITVYATDSDGMSAEDSATLYVNGVPEAPTVHIDPDPAQSDEPLTAIIDTAAYDPDGDTVSYGYHWYLNGVDTGLTTNPLPAAATARGDVWTVYVYPDDGYIEGPAGTDSITVGNSPPTMTGVTITPATAYTDDTLTANPAGFTDDDGDTEAWHYQWNVNGSALSGATDPTLAGSNFVRGDSVTVTVWPYDGREEGTSTTSAARTIEDSTPTTPVVLVTPRSPEREDDLTCTATSSDTDGDTLTYAYSWTKDSAPTGETGSTISAALTENGEVWTCSVTATDGTETSAAGSDSVTIDDYVNVPPEAPTIHITPDPAQSDDALTAVVDVDSYDLDGDTISYGYRWYADGVDSGVTSVTLPASATTRGETWTVVVTPNDGHQDGDSESASILVENTPPSMSSASISPSTAYTDDTLTATPSGFADDDGDTAGYRYQWYLGGGAISGATSSTLAGTYFSKGDSVTVGVTPWDGIDVGTTVTSPSLTISNSTPTAPGVDLTPTYPEDDDSLACSVATASSDADGDTITYAYSWTVNGVASGLSTSTVASSYTRNGETWVCSVTASDGTATSSPGSDSSLVSDYTAPSAPVLTTLSPYRNQTSANVAGTGEVSATITLYKDCGSGISTTSGTSSGTGTFSISQTLTAGTNCSFYATATDSYGNTSAVSNTVSTEACDPVDDYEDATSYGDSCTDPIIDWSTLSDAGTTALTFTGNILDATDEDWYYVETSDSLTTGLNYYNFHVEMVAGTSEYGFVVYEGGCGSAYLDCGSGSSGDPEGSGYTEYNYFAQDAGDGSHTIPSDYRACYDSNGAYNNCEDLSSDYYIHVFRTSSAYSCQEYTLEITNGVW